MAELKQEVAAPGQLMLVLKNVPLEEGRTLGSCGVEAGAGVHAVPAKEGGVEEGVPQAARP